MYLGEAVGVCGAGVPHRGKVRRGVPCGGNWEMRCVS